MEEINTNILFNKLMETYQYRFLKEDNWKFSSISNMKEYDLYVNLDLSKFTSFDTVSNAMFSIDVESVDSYTELFIYKTYDYNLEEINDTTELNSYDVGSNDTYDDFNNIIEKQLKDENNQLI